MSGSSVSWEGEDSGAFKNPIHAAEKVGIHIAAIGLIMIMALLAAISMVESKGLLSSLVPIVAIPPSLLAIYLVVPRVTITPTRFVLAKDGLKITCVTLTGERLQVVPWKDVFDVRELPNQQPPRYRMRFRSREALTGAGEIDLDREVASKIRGIETMVSLG